MVVVVVVVSWWRCCLLSILNPTIPYVAKLSVVVPGVIGRGDGWLAAILVPPD